MNLSDIIKSDLESIFSNHITKSATYEGNVYSAISSDLVTLVDNQNEGILRQSDMTLIFIADDFTALPIEGEFMIVDGKTLKIIKATTSSDGSKITLEFSSLRNK